jgi:homoserine trans-succinylase
MRRKNYAYTSAERLPAYSLLKEENIFVMHHEERNNRIFVRFILR